MQSPEEGEPPDSREVPSLKQLLQRWIDSRDQEAASELFRRYVERLLKMADAERSQMNSIESAYFDAFGSLLRRAHAMTFFFDHDDWLWRLLATIAKRKKIQRYRKQKELTGGDLLAELTAMADGDPSPDEVAAFNDTRRRLWAALNDKERIYLEMREKLFSQKEIAAEMGNSPRTVRRIARDVEIKASRICDLSCPPEAEESTDDDEADDSGTSMA